MKILKNIRNIVELTVKVEKSKCNRLHSRYKVSDQPHTFWVAAKESVKDSIPLGT